MKVYHTLGLMSGTSLDGLDITLCSFTQKDKSWSYKLEKACTISYNADWRERLSKAHNLSPHQLIELDHVYGRWIGLQCEEFLETVIVKPELIASHGHTIFHQPEKGYTLQIGNGNDINAITGIPVVFDFRSMDIALGGKGAPLVPAGDELLFPEYDKCLNLGGFSNISYKNNSKRMAFDICPVNMAINHLANKLGHLYDKDGAIAKEGTIIEELLQKLNGLDFYQTQPPRTLMREWFETEFLPLLNDYLLLPDNTRIHPDDSRTNPDNARIIANHSRNIQKDKRTTRYSTRTIPDIMRTIYEHIAIQITEVLKTCNGGKTLITGGGARNTFLISLLQEKSSKKQQLIIPDLTLVDYKEALIFGFLGLLRKLNMINCFSSVTGAERDSSAGIVVGI